jgi:RNA polymerase sigma factor (sigma-70 family)
MSNPAVVQVLDRMTVPYDRDVDARLLTRFRADRDEAAFAALVRRHGPLVCGVCRRILGDRTDADDAFQAVFFVLARRAGTVKADRGIGPWLHGVALRVAKKARTQTVRRRLREMAAAKADRVDVPETETDFWTVVDEELARLSLRLREVVLLCDLDGRSHAQAAGSLGLAKGTVTKRLARAHGELAVRLKRRGITLGLGALSTLLATRATVAVPATLLLETARQAVTFASGRVGSSLAAHALAEGVMRSIKVNIIKAWVVVGLLGLALAGGGLMLAGGPDDPCARKGEQPKATDATPAAPTGGIVWKECFTGEYETSLPVSVAFSGNGQTLLTGDNGGEVMAIRFPSDPPTYAWKAQVGGTHAAVAYSANRKYVYATAEYGVQILDATTGKAGARIDEPNSNPVAIGVFPDKLDAKIPQVQIVFGNARGYFVKSWSEWGKPADTMSTIATSTVAKGATPTDAAAVPLAVDPKGRSAIMTGPYDAKGEVAGVKGKNVLWAYVCGDYADGSPGNRVMVGHTATVVSAAWSKEGGTAVTGDADGRVIVWDAKTMKEARRVELGGRVLAIAISDDGTYTAACVRGKQGGEFYVWETAKPKADMRPIHNQPGDFSGEPCASLTFSADGKHLAGCVIDRKWPERPAYARLNGQVHVWELAAEPKAQLPPKHVYTKPLPKGGPASFVVLNNFTILTAANTDGAIDYRDIRDGEIQARTVLGKFALGAMKLSSDHKWLAMEQRKIVDPQLTPLPPTTTFDVGVWDMKTRKLRTVHSCEGMLDVASGGRVVAVVREKRIEVWDVATEKLVKSAPFKHTRIDAARFSPDGRLLAVSDRNDLVLWRWEEDKHDRIDLGRCVGSLEFTPDGKFLAEGPTPGDAVHVRDMETRKVVQTLANGTKQSMNVPRIAYTQGGRVLIGCDNILKAKGADGSHRLTLWDTATGAVAHQIALPAGLPAGIDVSPNGRYLATVVEDGDSGISLNVWRLEGEMPVKGFGPTPPAAVRPR